MPENLHWLPRWRRRGFLAASTAGLLASRLAGQTRSKSPTPPPAPGGQDHEIFPYPASVSRRPGRFAMDDQTVILVPPDATAEELFLARSLRNEVADWHGLILGIEHASDIPAGLRVFVMGLSERPLVRAALARAGADPQAGAGKEAYSLCAGKDVAVVAGSDFSGAVHGYQSLRQLVTASQDGLGISCVDIQDRPQKPFRGLKLYLPGKQNIAFFKRFVQDFVAPCKYNTLIVELNAGMRLESHPELNAGWREMVMDTNYSRRNYPPGALHNREQNSCHQDTADGGFIEKNEVAELAAFVRSMGIEWIPELPSFTHSYYLLTRHKHLSEVPGDKWPDTYCPSNPETYRLLFDVYDEYIELLKPRMVHIGRDELFAPVGLCPRCGDRDIGERYGEDVTRVHAHLRGKDVRAAMWGDMLLESVRGKGLQQRSAPDGWKYKVAGGMTAAQVDRYIPKDILIFNWFWSEAPGEWTEERAEENEAILDRMGFEQVFGNLSSAIQNYPARSRRQTILGGAPSAWCATNEFNFGKIMLPDFLSCSNLLWSGEVITGAALSGIVQSRMPHIRSRFRGALPPSQTEASISPVDITSAFNTAGGIPNLACNLRHIRRGRVAFGKMVFDLAASGEKRAAAAGTRGSKPPELPRTVSGIRIGRDASSVLFLHACGLPANNREPDRLLWDVFDSADVLGWYEIVFEDGYTETVPLRYGVNIAEWDWASRKSDRDYCYAADAVVVSGGGPNQITMFAYEWENTRPGQVIAEVRLKGTSGFRGAEADYTNHYGPVIGDNALVLAAVSIVEPRAPALHA